MRIMSGHFPSCLTIRDIKYKNNRNPFTENYLSPLCLDKFFMKSERA